ncbi:MAG: NAD-dependent protein deacetylase 1 [Phycisphaerae bacterium]|nr:MAG: NAD-dependent protein deacetylase 1 [Phycisphaerae bacterium]
MTVSDGMDAAVDQLAQWLRASRRIVAFTGAGISTESGIADFRSPGGLWSRHAPVMFDDFLNDPAERRRFWEIRREMMPSFFAATPNAGHLALAELERRGKLLGVITQNIDELHQRAGSRRVVEIHGTAMTVHCLECDKRWSARDIQSRLEAGEWDLRCDACGGLLKSRTVSFGQQMPADVMREAIQLASSGDLFIAMGSSLVVQPAAGLPVTAMQRGARVVILNRESTPLDFAAALVIRAGIGETMSAVMARLG